MPDKQDFRLEGDADRMAFRLVDRCGAPQYWSVARRWRAMQMATTISAALEEAARRLVRRCLRGHLRR